MATEKRRITFVIEDDLYAEFDAWMKSNSIHNMSLGVNVLLRAALHSPDSIYGTNDRDTEAIVIEAEPTLVKDLHAYAMEHDMVSLSDPAKELMLFGLLALNNQPKVISGSHAFMRDEIYLLSHFLTGTPAQRAAIIQTVKTICYRTPSYHNEALYRLFVGLDAIADTKETPQSESTGSGDF